MRFVSFSVGVMCGWNLTHNNCRWSCPFRIRNCLGRGPIKPKQHFERFHAPLYRVLGANNILASRQILPPPLELQRCLPSRKIRNMTYTSPMRPIVDLRPRGVCAPANFLVVLSQSPVQIHCGANVGLLPRCAPQIAFIQRQKVNVEVAHIYVLFVYFKYIERRCLTCHIKCGC